MVQLRNGKLFAKLNVRLRVVGRRLHLLDELKQGTLSFTAEVFHRAVIFVAQVGVRVHRHGLAERVREGFAHARWRNLLANFAAEPARGDRHPVLCQRTSFVCVELRGASHGFTRLQATHEILVRHHFSHGERQAESNCKRQTLRNRDHDDRHGVDEKLEDERTVPFSTLGAVGDPANHAREESQHGGADAEVTDEEDESLEPLLKRRIARFDDQRLQDDAPLRS
mmetsp:Transcript_4680/g.17903  ORF Transcript_4680/g.17903 Transcript_4680/m.17903 type:complete len:225 (-) Transcript_4680:239-913(-)